MPLLPQYQRVEDVEETVPLKMTARSSFDVPTPVDELTPAYPPSLVTETSTSMLPKITYTFRPRYPILGNDQHAVGVMGRNSEVRLFLA